MDIQFKANIWACIAYLTNCICKPERTISEMMKKACKEANDKDIQQKLRHISNELIKGREVSQHECIIKALSIPLRRSNTTVVYIPTDKPENRTRILKSKAVLDKMESDETDIYVAGVHEKYPARPDNLDNLSLADFVANYVTTSITTQANDETEEEQEETNIVKNKILLKDQMGAVYKRKKFHCDSVSLYLKRRR